jgi:hypothetical protein
LNGRKEKKEINSLRQKKGRKRKGREREMQIAKFSSPIFPLIPPSPLCHR